MFDVKAISVQGELVKCRTHFFVAPKRINHDLVAVFTFFLVRGDVSFSGYDSSLRTSRHAGYLDRTAKAGNMAQD